MSGPDPDALREWLDERGFGLFATLPIGALPSAVRHTLADNAIDTRAYSSLVLIGHAGASLWPHIDPHVGADPIDDYSRRCVDALCATWLPEARRLDLYPGPLSIPLQALGAAVRWHHPSPLGLGIHPRHGLWFAYRAAFLTSAELPAVRETSSVSPCDTCADRPCRRGCPVGAVHGPGGFDLNACTTQRLRPDSVCATRCNARLACPVARHEAYSAPQLDYHGRRSLQSLRRWAATADPAE